MRRVGHRRRGRASADDSFHREAPRSGCREMPRNPTHAPLRAAVTPRRRLSPARPRTPPLTSARSILAGWAKKVGGAGKLGPRATRRRRPARGDRRRRTRGCARRAPTRACGGGGRARRRTYRRRGEAAMGAAPPMRALAVRLARIAGWASPSCALHGARPTRPRQPRAGVTAAPHADARRRAAQRRIVGRRRVWTEQGRVAPAHLLVSRLARGVGGAARYAVIRRGRRPRLRRRRHRRKGELGRRGSRRRPARADAAAAPPARAEAQVQDPEQRGGRAFRAARRWRRRARRRSAGRRPAASVSAPRPDSITHLSAFRTGSTRRRTRHEPHRRRASRREQLRRSRGGA